MLEQTTTDKAMTEVTDITNTYKVKGVIYTRKQRVSTFISNHQDGDYLIEVRGTQGRISNGQVVEGNLSPKALINKAYKVG